MLGIRSRELLASERQGFYNGRIFGHANHERQRETPVQAREAGKSFVYPRNKDRLLWPDRGEKKWAMVDDGFRYEKTRL